MTTGPRRGSQIDEARKVAQELLDALESSRTEIDSALMKAKRLDRLMRDRDAQTWLELETIGYPSGFNFKTLGTCMKYAVTGGRLTPEGTYYPQSLPQMEARRKADESVVQASGTSRSPTPKARDYTEKGATEALLVTYAKMQIGQKDAFIQSQGLFASFKSALHSYATDTYLALEFGDVVQGIFEQAREEVDTFVRAYCPKAAEQLVAMSERLREDLTESRSAALTSCRRLLMTVADALFPAQSMTRVDSKGKERKVGPDEYKNRLLAFIDVKIEAGHDSNLSIVAPEIDHLAARLDAIYEKSCKGVHADVSREEARLVVIQTYLFIAELARLLVGTRGLDAEAVAN
jgi:hypothetical protein